MLSIEHERLERQKQIEEKAKEEHILEIVLFTCNPLQHEYYKMMQEQIMAKTKGDAPKLD